MVVDTLISLGIMGVLVYIAMKAEIINHNSDMILDLIIGWGKSPPLPPPSAQNYDAKKHSECYPMM